MKSFYRLFFQSGSLTRWPSGGLIGWPWMWWTSKWDDSPGNIGLSFLIFSFDVLTLDTQTFSIKNECLLLLLFWRIPYNVEHINAMRQKKLCESKKWHCTYGDNGDVQRGRVKISLMLRVSLFSDKFCSLRQQTVKGMGRGSWLFICVCIIVHWTIIIFSF